MVRANAWSLPYVILTYSFINKESVQIMIHGTNLNAKVLDGSYIQRYYYIFGH
jgi:hypothetical protein